MTQTERFLDYLEKAARQSLLDEVSATPKPGLVDTKDSGAHQDMDFSTFTASTEAIVPFLRKMGAAGIEAAGEAASSVPSRELSELFVTIRSIGSEAEKAMFSATNGVNTHKGIIFSMGINAAAAGYLYGKGLPLHGENILATGQQMCCSLLSKDFKQINSELPKTHGELLYIKYGCRGIRGEAMDGFPAVRDIGLPIIRSLTANHSMDNQTSKEQEGVHNNDTFWNQLCLRLLFEFMAKVEDSNVLFRCDYEALSYLRKQSLSILAEIRKSETEGRQSDTNLWPPALFSHIEALNGDFIQRNISAGGCADLLSLTLFIWRLEQGIVSCDHHLTGHLF